MRTDFWPEARVIEQSEREITKYTHVSYESLSETEIELE